MSDDATPPAPAYSYQCPCCAQHLPHEVPSINLFPRGYFCAKESTMNHGRLGARPVRVCRVAIPRKPLRHQE